MALQLKAGRTYRTRNGRVVTIDKNSEHCIYPFFEERTAWSWTMDGTYYFDTESDLDLVEEVKQPGTMDVVAEGAPGVSSFVSYWNDMASQLGATARAKGFYAKGVKSIEYMLGWMHSELGEVFTSLQYGNPESEKIPGFSQVEEELADVVILLMDTARAHGLRVAEAVLAKNAHNLTRPYQHNKQL